MSTRLSSPEELENLRRDILSRRDHARPIITVCAGTGCQTYGAADVYQAIVGEVKKQGLETKLEVKATGCHGFCEKGVVVVIHPEEICYVKVTTD